MLQAVVRKLTSIALTKEANACLQSASHLRKYFKQAQERQYIDAMSVLSVIDTFSSIADSEKK